MHTFGLTNIAHQCIEPLCSTWCIMCTTCRLNLVGGQCAQREQQQVSASPAGWTAGQVLVWWAVRLTWKVRVHLKLGCDLMA
jgi:hypothetical protein